MSHLPLNSVQRTWKMPFTDFKQIIPWNTIISHCIDQYSDISIFHVSLTNAEREIVTGTANPIPVQYGSEKCRWRFVKSEFCFSQYELRDLMWSSLKFVCIHWCRCDNPNNIVKDKDSSLRLLFTLTLNITKRKY